MNLPSLEYGRWELQAERYDVLDAYRINQDLYNRLTHEIQLRGYAGYKNLRNPANRLVELYTSKLTDKLLDHLDTEREDDVVTPDVEISDTEGVADVPTTIDPDVLKGLIEQVHTWSNWQDRVEVAARNFPTYGDLFIKIDSANGRVQLNLLDPRVVNENFQKDERGYFTYLRLDIPQEEHDPDEDTEVREFTRTEVWDKEAGQYMVFEHEEPAGRPLKDLGAPIFFALLTSDPPPGPNVNWTGFDFIPVVHRKLKDTGEDRGEGAFQHALDNIDAANYLATKMHQMLFPEVTWKGTREVGPGGTMLGPMRLETEEEDDEILSRLTAVQQEDYRVVNVAGDRTVMLPSGADLVPMVPPLDFQSHLLALDSHLKELEKDLPELAYYRLRDMTEISGVAAKILLGDVIDRLGRARQKFEDAHVKAHEMALTIGKVTRVPGFEVIPDNAFEEGVLDHGFEEYELFPASRSEQATEDKTEADALSVYKTLGPSVYAQKLKEYGLAETDEEATQMASDSNVAQPSPIDQILGNNQLQ